MTREQVRLFAAIRRQLRQMRDNNHQMCGLPGYEISDCNNDDCYSYTEMLADLKLLRELA